MTARTLIGSNYIRNLRISQARRAAGPARGCFPRHHIQARVSAGQEAAGGHAPKSVHPKRASGPYLLSGLLRCETCGKALTAAEAESGKSTYYVLPLPAEAGQRNMQDPRAQCQDLREVHRQRDQGERPQRAHHPSEGSCSRIIKARGSVGNLCPLAGASGELRPPRTAEQRAPDVELRRHEPP